MLSPALQTEYARYENGHYSYRIHRSPLCEYMINFIHKLKHLPEKYMMNSVLENFTILQVCVCGCVCRWGQMCVCRCGEKVCVYRCGKAGVCWGTGVKAGVFMGTDECAGVNTGVGGMCVVCAGMGAGVRGRWVVCAGVGETGVCVGACGKAGVCWGQMCVQV